MKPYYYDRSYEAVLLRRDVAKDPAATPTRRGEGSSCSSLQACARQSSGPMPQRPRRRTTTRSTSRTSLCSLLNYFFSAATCPLRSPDLLLPAPPLLSSRGGGARARHSLRSLPPRSDPWPFPDLRASRGEGHSSRFFVTFTHCWLEAPALLLLKLVVHASSKASNDKKYQSARVASPAKAISPKCVKHIVPSKQLILSGDSIGHVASFLVKVIALEAVRRVSKARCPFIWNSVQALQILVYPPFSWIQRWAPLKFVVHGIQKLSMPLLFLSVTTTLSDRSSKRDDEHGSNAEGPEEPTESNETASTSSTRDVADGTKDIVSENWLVSLFNELEKQAISLPERFTEDELRRFYVAANGDFSCLLSSIKKTIRWRETFHILSLQELEKWSHLVFWHGFDAMLRPCLVIRLGLACSSIAPRDRPRFGQAVVSQIDHGVVNLINKEDPRITVLLDCHGISPFRFPMQMMRSFITVVQENYPNRLAVLFVVRLPPVVRVIAQTLIQVLKPSTKQKLRFEGDSYKKTLAEFLQVAPAFLGGKCSCSQCAKPRDNSVIPAGEGSKSQPHRISAEDGSPVASFDFDEAEIPSLYSCENTIRAAIIGLLMLCIFIAFLAGMNDPTSVPSGV